jgi:hypothetical protein
MKQFQPKTVAQQKKDYVRSVRQAWSNERNALASTHAFELEHAQIMLSKASDVAQMIGPIQDRVANDADREFGETTWRRDKKLLKIVADRMASRSAMCQARVDRLREKAAKARAPYDKAMRRAKSRFEKLIRTAK